MNNTEASINDAPLTSDNDNTNNSPENKDIAESTNTSVTNIKKKRSLGSYLRKLIILCFGAFLYSAGLEIFLIPNQIIDGGVVGISIMVSHVTDIPFSILMLIINLPFLYLGYSHIGKTFSISTIISICFLSFWTEYFQPIPQVTDDFFLAAIFGGITAGAGVGLIIRNSGSLDGTEIVAIILDKKSTFSVGEIVLFFNIFILGAAGFVFSWDKAMYSLVAYFIISKMIDVVLKGLDESYAVMIVSDENLEIADALMSRLGRGVTFLSGQGAYTGDPKKVLYCVVTRLELDKLKDIAIEKDDNAFITINPVHDIVGGRFNKKSIH
ncbi:MAG: YitT family protein [Anaerovibrio sp.]|uniref:YitT family protein n=1 Tax=Anaerovibrio sp. TaxID=1872532 RepID=UPI0025D0275C|nr:YitT family protein [Anaerovibrio sp.]MCR5176806.1 YitT family protein [Anaerovibrio sp.]